MRLLAMCIATGCLAGCASSSENIEPSYVSPIAYQNYDCRQLAQEARRVSVNAARAAGVQDKKANSDTVATGVAVVLFWPAAFFVSGGDGPTAAELAKLRDQKEAIEQASIKKGCDIRFERGSG